MSDEEICDAVHDHAAQCDGCVRKGARLERAQAARIIRDLLDVHRLGFEAFGTAIMDPDLNREAIAYITQAEAEKNAPGPGGPP